MSAEAKPVAEPAAEKPEEKKEESESEDDMPELEPSAPGAAPASGAAPSAAELKKKQKKAEKKARKLVQKLGLKPITGINRVTVKNEKNIVFAFSRPDVYKAPGSDTYIIFGEPKVEDIGARAQAAAAEQFKMPDFSALSQPGTEVPSLVPDEKKEAKEEKKEAAPEAPVDATGLNEADINTLIKQQNCSRADAVRVLRENEGDLVNAIMALQK
ncbi:putative nascent polypeptide-associated complex subunit alpha [Paratrimastix pyriformis]|uniref:Nascent polypeptide-associated complex subunit alpha n=1 Tax=Paratrimastix pyriformis TaxID=342808 RepID=A0ABQ8UHE0_9EUKA|nr:putative nascent polypeptide-associated complex subunit alpha [Paratrimastix pyriformis]